MSVNSITSSFVQQNTDYAAVDNAADTSSRIMLSWGGFEFSIDTVAYNQLERTQEWRWAEQALIGKGDILQYTGKAAREVTLTGDTHARFRNGRGISAIDDLFELADKAEPQLLVSSLGDIFGYWVATRHSDTTSSFSPGGGGKTRGFTIGFRFYGDKLSN